MGFSTEFNSICKFKSGRELEDLFEYGKTKMRKNGFRIYPTGMKLIAFDPDNRAVAIVKISASIAEIDFQGREVTLVEMDLVRRLTPHEAEVETALADEMFFRDHPGA